MKRELLPLPETLPEESLFGAEGQEFLDDAIEDTVRSYVEGVDSIEKPGLSMVGCIEAASWPLLVNEFRRMEKPSAGRLLDRLLDDWHEDYGDPGGDPPTATPAMLAAMQAILDGLTVWACEETGRSFSVTKEDAMRLLEGEA